MAGLHLISPRTAEDATVAERVFFGMRAWAERTFGKPADEVTVADVDRVLPRRDDLEDPPFTDSRGGRVRYRLQAWPNEVEAERLRLGAEEFRTSGGANAPQSEPRS